MPVFDPAVFDETVFDAVAASGSNPTTIMGSAALWYVDAAQPGLAPNADGSGTLTDGGPVRFLPGLAGPNAVTTDTAREAIYRAGSGDPYIEGDAGSQLRATLARAAGDFYAIMRVQFRGTGTQFDQPFTIATDTNTFYNGTAWADVKLNPFLSPTDARFEVGTGTEPTSQDAPRDTWHTIEVYGTATENGLAVNGATFVTGSRSAAFPATAYIDLFNSVDGGAVSPGVPTWFRRGAVLNAIPDSTQRAALLTWATDGDTGGSGTDNLAPNNLVTGSTTLGNPALNQRHALAANSLVTGSPVVGNPSVGQRHALGATGVTTGSPVLGTPSVAQSHSLNPSAVVTGNPVLGTPIIGQVHQFGATNLVTGSVILGNPSLGGSTVALSANNLITGAPVVGTPVLGQRHALTASSLTTSSPVVSPTTLGQSHTLTATGITTGSPTLGTPTLGQRHSLTGNNLVTGEPVLGNTELPPPVNLTTTDLVAGSPTLGQPAISQVLVITPDNIITGEVLTGNPTLYQYNLGDLQVNYNRTRTIRIDLLSQEPRVSSQLQQTRVAPVNTRDESRVIKVLNENRTLKL